MFQSLLFSVAPAAPACACEHAFFPGASAGHVSRVFATIVILPVSFALNRAVNARSAYADDANTPAQTTVKAATNNRPDQPEPPRCAATEEPGSPTPASLRMRINTVPLTH